MSSHKKVFLVLVSLLLIFFVSKLFATEINKDKCLEKNNVSVCLDKANEADARYKELQKQIEENSKEAKKYKEHFCTLSGFPKNCKSSELNFIVPNL